MRTCLRYIQLACRVWKVRSYSGNHTVNLPCHGCLICYQPTNIWALSYSIAYTVVFFLRLWPRVCQALPQHGHLDVLSLTNNLTKHFGGQDRRYRLLEKQVEEMNSRQIACQCNGDIQHMRIKLEHGIQCGILSKVSNKCDAVWFWPIGQCAYNFIYLRHDRWWYLLQLGSKSYHHTKQRMFRIAMVLKNVWLEPITNEHTESIARVIHQQIIGNMPQQWPVFFS